MKVNGFDVLELRFTYSNPIEKGNIIIRFLYKDGNFLWVIGTFSAPLYSELQADITAVLNSIRRDAKQEQGDSQAEMSIASIESGKSIQHEDSNGESIKSTVPGSANGQQRGAAAAEHHSFRGYTFLVPHNWSILPGAEIGLYMSYDKKDPKAFLFFRVLYGNQIQLEEMENLFIKQIERHLEVGAQIDGKLIENKKTTINNLDATILHYTLSNQLTKQKADTVMVFFYKDGSILWLTGVFPSPLYSGLQKDITDVLNSIRKN
jgi:hypothetical protein